MGKSKSKYYRLDNILKHDAQYNIIVGERSNGKTFAALEYGIKQWADKGKQTAIVRRWREDFIGKRGENMFTSLVSENIPSKLTGGEWTDITYHASRWYMCRYDGEGKRVKQETPFAIGFSVGGMEHDKSTSYPDITTVVYDEFITRQIYMGDEFVLYMNLLSTIIRDRDDVKIFMLGNTVSKYCPYFNEMGLKHIKDMKPGSIDIYQYGETKLKVAVEMTKTNEQGKLSDKYFAFDNPRLEMIKSGAWEMDIYPHLPVKYKPMDLVYKFYIDFDRTILEAEIVVVDDLQFIYMHPKTTELELREDDLIYTPEYNPSPNYRRNILIPRTRLETKIKELCRNDLVYYSSNDIGEHFKHYVKWCNEWH